MVILTVDNNFIRKYFNKLFCSKFPIFGAAGKQKKEKLQSVMLTKNKSIRRWIPGEPLTSQPSHSPLQRDAQGNPPAARRWQRPRGPLRRRRTPLPPSSLWSRAPRSRRPSGGENSSSCPGYSVHGWQIAAVTLISRHGHPRGGASGGIQGSRSRTSTVGA